MRVLESRISIRHSAVKPWRLRMPQPVAFWRGAAAGPAAAFAACVSVTVMKIAIAARMPASAESDDGRLPRDAREQQQADDAAESELADVAEEVVGAERGAPALAGKGVRYDGGAQRVLDR